ncbi:hypothetical protein THRCLA_04934 [Thraustotheca clavata]|uniref:C2CD3 N-terminal C2 domain-containing protein n=1 Tax=Thraustotheca clavata TaxID=74557 RepID=A0A1V9ZXH3_9STRA|nr:hypothetical protein THRCLA_04934 [Thraustotheca clavata]
MPHEGTIIALGSLPPHVDGPVMGYVRVRVHVNVANASPLSWLVRIRWWGTVAMNQLGDVLREGQVLCFPVNVSKERFQKYVNDMGPLRFDVVNKDSHQVFGFAEIPLSWTDLETMGKQIEADISGNSGMDSI